MRRIALVRALTIVVAASAASALAAPSTAGSSHGVHFGKPVVVDPELAGGEPMVMWDRFHRVFVYTSHEGETHTYPQGLTSPSSMTATAPNTRNNVNMWTSRDGLTWTRVNLPDVNSTPGSGSNAGFSDPDLAQDAAGRVYNTGIDMVNDSLFSSPDGGRTWDKGTPNCHDGDRPWVAGGPRNTVFLSTTPFAGDHAVVESTDAGMTCSTLSFAHRAGRGKLWYDAGPNPALHGALIEPTSSGLRSVGVGVLPHAVQAFTTGDGAFVDHIASKTDGFYEHFPAVALDSYGNIYLVWADAGSNGRNTVWLTMSRDGIHWTKRYAVAHPGSTVLWPWVAAGSPGNVSVVWWQYSKALTSPADNALPMSVMEATILGFGTSQSRTYTVDAAGRPIHLGPVCGGDFGGCIISRSDRRMGDYFTNAIDGNGCVLIATADTTQPDPLTGADKAWSTPIFLRQDGGPSLTGGTCSRP